MRVHPVPKNLMDVGNPRWNKRLATRKKHEGTWAVAFGVTRAAVL